MNEEEFIQSIDCNFPYNDDLCVKEIIKIGCSISSNAAFMILHEISRPPRCKIVEKFNLLQILSEFEKTFKHPLKRLLCELVGSIILDQQISEVKAIQVMEQIEIFRNQICALNIAYFSPNATSKCIEIAYDSIIDKWENENFWTPISEESEKKIIFDFKDWSEGFRERLNCGLEQVILNYLLLIQALENADFEKNYFMFIDDFGNWIYTRESLHKIEKLLLPAEREKLSLWLQLLDSRIKKLYVGEDFQMSKQFMSKYPKEVHWWFYGLPRCVKS